MKRPLAVCLLILGCYLAECSVTAQEDASMNNVSTAIFAPIRMCNGTVGFDEGLKRILGYLNLDSSVENGIIVLLDPFLPQVKRYYGTFCDAMKQSMDRWQEQTTKVVAILDDSPRVRRCLASVARIISNFITRAHDVIVQEGLVYALQALYRNLTLLPSNVMNLIRKMSWHFIEYFILPLVMQAVNVAMKSGLLPSGVMEGLTTLNTMYHLLQMTGYLPAQ